MRRKIFLSYACIGVCCQSVLRPAYEVRKVDLLAAAGLQVNGAGPLLVRMDPRAQPPGPGQHADLRRDPHRLPEPFRAQYPDQQPRPAIPEVGSAGHRFPQRQHLCDRQPDPGSGFPRLRDGALLPHRKAIRNGGRGRKQRQRLPGRQGKPGNGHASTSKKTGSSLSPGAKRKKAR